MQLLRWLTSLFSVSPRAVRPAAVSRRELISLSFLLRQRPPVIPTAAPLGSRARPMGPLPILRPPGALPEADFLTQCTRCGDCLPACPPQAIRLAPARFRAAAGTPMIEVYEQPCLMCTDTPCISACTPAALVRNTDAPVPAIGLARISTLDCLAHQGGSCFTCSERCPVEGAISLHAGRPTVHPEHCTGCGICAQVCPAPRHAIILLPLSRT